MSLIMFAGAAWDMAEGALPYLKAAGSYDAAKESERDLLTTDGDGFASSKMLPYGHYTVHQVSGEEGKAFIPDFTVFISSNGQTYSYVRQANAPPLSLQPLCWRFL